MLSSANILVQAKQQRHNKALHTDALRSVRSSLRYRRLDSNIVFLPRGAGGTDTLELMNEDYLRFVPSKVEGLPDVTELIVYSDRLEFQSAGRKVIFRFFDIAEWPRPRWLRRFLFRLGQRSLWLPVGDRDWFHPPSERFFQFYTLPAITVYMPQDEPEDYQESYFFRTQEVIRRGGFSTFDLG